MRLVPVLLVIGMLLVPSCATVERDDVEPLDLAGFQGFMETTSMRCELGEGSQVSYQDRGSVNVEISTWTGEPIVFDSIDAQAGTARMISNQQGILTGVADVTVLATQVGLTFVETTPLGSVFMTTVFARAVSSSDSRFIAVHSRHRDLLINPLPSQWHGACQVLA